MGSIRKRGKSWNAQVRLSGWRSFTKSFSRKSDALIWVEETENEIKNLPKSRVNVGQSTLKDLLKVYGLKISSRLKSSDIELIKINFYSHYPIARNKLVDLTLKHFEHFRHERLKTVKPGTVHSNLMLFRRIFKTAINKWGYGLLTNPLVYIQLPPPHKSMKIFLYLENLIIVSTVCLLH